MRTQGSGWGGGIILYQVCPKCGKKKCYYTPLQSTHEVPPFRCTSCKERFNSAELIRKTYK